MQSFRRMVQTKKRVPHIVTLLPTPLLGTLVLVAHLGLERGQDDGAALDLAPVLDTTK